MNQLSTYCLILITSFLSLKSIGQPGKKIIIPPLPSYYLTSKDSNRYAFFICDAKRDYDHFKGECKPATLSKQELFKIEGLIKSRVAIYNKGYGKINNSLKYYKQLIAVTNNKGEKEVWVNCCCSVMEYWKKRIQFTLDGGSCYFNLKINLDKNIAYDFGVNGLG